MISVAPVTNYVIHIIQICHEVKLINMTKFSLTNFTCQMVFD